MLNKYKHKIKVEIPFNENDFIDIIKKLIDVNHKYYYLKNISKYVKSISVNSKYVNNNTIKNLFPDKKNKIYYDYISQDISVYCFPQNKNKISTQIPSQTSHPHRNSLTNTP